MTEKKGETAMSGKFKESGSTAADLKLESRGWLSSFAGLGIMVLGKKLQRNVMMITEVQGEIGAHVNLLE
jgi:hypothetical protein